MLVYVDTSVFGGVFDPEFERWTHPGSAWGLSSHVLIEPFAKSVLHPAATHDPVSRGLPDHKIRDGSIQESVFRKSTNLTGLRQESGFLGCALFPEILGTIG